jgi:hypothetical protein
MPSRDGPVARTTSGSRTIAEAPLADCTSMMSPSITRITDALIVSCAPHGSR